MGGSISISMAGRSILMAIGMYLEATTWGQETYINFVDCQ